MILELRSPVYANAEQTLINFEVRFDFEPESWLPFTYAPNQTEAHFKWIEETWLSDQANVDLIAPYVEPPVVVIIPQSISPRQARLVLALQPSPETQPADWDEQANGAWQPTYATLLAFIEANFQELPEPDKTVATITWEYATEVLRSDPLVAQMAAMIPLTEQQIDDLFLQASQL